MASVKSTAIVLLVLIVLAGAAVGGTYVYFQLQARAVQNDLNVAASYLTQGKAADADRLLASRLEGARLTAAWYARALALRLQALEQMNDTQALHALATATLDPQAPLARAGSDAWRRAHIILGQEALDAQNIPEAQQHFEALLAQPAGSTGQAAATLGLARIQMAQGQLEPAQKQLAALLDTLAPDAPERPGVEKALGLCNLHMLESPTPYGDDKVYSIAKGDTLDALRKKFNVDPSILMAINHIRDPKLLSIGNRIKIPDVDFSILVNKTDNTLTLFNRGKFFKKYTVRTGQEDYMTPPGDFTIISKVVDPVWNNPQDHKQYAANAPDNQLGCRWMGFVGSNLGIHEAIDPTTLGHYSSNGCVGMAKDDVMELFNLVPLHTPVKIIGTIQKTAAAAAAAAIPIQPSKR